MSSRIPEVDLLDVWETGWRHRILVAGLVAFGVIMAAGVSFMVPRKYSAQVTLIPQAPMQSGGLLGRLATLTSVSMALEASNEDLYGQILRSNRMLDKLVGKKWAASGPVDSLSVAEVLGMDFESRQGAAYLEGVEVFKKRLRKNVVRYNRDPATGFMKIQVTMPKYPELSAELADFLADELDEYNIAVKTKRAKEHRIFVAESLMRVTGQLEEAEQTLVDFVTANSSYANSAVLTRQYEILDREVTAQRNVWYQLRSELETAKIEEHKQIGSLNILDQAAVPVRSSAPNRVLFLLAGAAAGLLLAVVILVSRSARRGSAAL